MNEYKSTRVIVEIADAAVFSYIYMLKIRVMKRIGLGVAAALMFFGCQENAAVISEFTGNEAVYPLLQASAYDVNGTVTFKEKTDGSTKIIVALSGTEGDVEHPVHLHLGNISTPDAAVTALLNPVLGKSGMSETNLHQLADETVVTYKQLVDFNACIKVHLGASGPDRDIILAGGNIGAASLSDITSGRTSISVCKSE